MPQTIYKYTFPNVGYDQEVTIEMPKESNILCFQNQFETPCIWACVNPSSKMTERTFLLACTGSESEELQKKDDLKYIGTAQFHQGSFVLHLFEILKEK